MYILGPMDNKNYSKAIHRIMIDEMDEIGKFIIKNQCYNLGIMPSYILAEDIPKLSKAISEAMLDFGEEKSGKIHNDILHLIN